MQIQNLAVNYPRDNQLTSGKRAVAPEESITIGKVNEEAKSSRNTVEQAERVNQPQDTVNFDEKTLAELERSTQLFAVNNSELNYQNSNQLAKEQITRNNQTAISSYQLVGNLAQRESVQSMMGVDLFA
ncbi:hypothetical protein [Litorilituus sediminis]|uniref:Uncharacterized protein n=1 Tax=Litorilituus sediminis TaxID=718192 RepID=A0A4P6P2C9_9GAMM|nr:hypothetical protein [Litorilituus sediminis]QBG35313.1 hypothetical protein EMK97_06050 [Litorilituus sediminis]